jgi:GTP-binding protein
MSCRSIAIVAHVDHGKTTLLDHMLRQSGTLEERGELVECVMDSNPQERERGITILAKCTAVQWEGETIQIVDTPGHQDFGGEVERILRMVDSVLLLVDAVEGPMPQTRYVLRKALESGFRPIVVINKMDRPQARPQWVHDKVFDLFDSLGANDEQLDFPLVYAAGRSGWASHDETDGTDLHPLFESIIEHVPVSKADPEGPPQLQVSTLDYSEYVGTIAIGRVQSGTIKRGMKAICCKPDASGEPFKVTKLMGFMGLQRIDREKVVAGEIVALAGVDRVTVGDTICAADSPIPIEPTPVDPPTVGMLFTINSSPFAGQEGQYVTSRQVRQRLFRELEYNVGLSIEEGDRPDCWRVAGRGTLHLSVLIETMRREGYELSVGQPQVLYRGNQEPWEEATVSVPSGNAGIVIEKLTKRGGSLTAHEVGEDGRATLRMEIPTRGLIGYRSEFLTDTRGEGLIYHTFLHYGPRAGELRQRENGAIISQDACETNAYGLNQLQERGKMLVPATQKVYGGQVIGLHSRTNDLVVNPGKRKQLTNVRSAGKDDAIRLTPHIELSLEQAIELIEKDEMVEVTPKNVRVRKRLLNHSARKREEKANAPK